MQYETILQRVKPEYRDAMRQHLEATEPRFTIPWQVWVVLVAFNAVAWAVVGRFIWIAIQ